MDQVRRRRKWPWLVGVPGVVVASLAGFAFTNYGNQALGLDDDQRATLSDPAAAHLSDKSTLVLPDFAVPMFATREAVLENQESFAAAEKGVEDGLVSRFGLRLEETRIADVPVTVITPPAATTGDRIAINIHGGGFVSGTSHDRVGLLMAHELGMTVYSIDYTLAPQAAFPVAVNQSLAVYRDLVARHDPRKVVAFASSAGGNLLLSMLLEAKAQQLPMIAAIAVFTPVTDLSGVGDSVSSNNGRDSLVKNIRVDVPARYYAAGQDLRSPKVSPVYADYPADFPPTVLTTGTRDLNLSDVVRQHWKLSKAGVATRLLVGEGMWHGFHWEPDMPEAVDTRAAVVGFLRDPA